MDENVAEANQGAIVAGGEVPGVRSARDPDYLDRLITENDAAPFLGHSVRTLQKWRVKGGGPPFVRISSRSIRYTRRELMRWAHARLCRRTSDRREK